MRLRVLLALLMCFFVRCKTPEVVVHDNMRTEVVQRLTPVFLPPEEASAQALIECNKEGMAILSRLNIETSRNAFLALRVDSLNNLSVSSVVVRDTVWIVSDSVVVTRDVLRTEIEYRDKELSRWGRFKQDMGGLAIGGCIALILGVVVYFLRKCL